jgi:curved DNA-binding protein CbpA
MEDLYNVLQVAPGADREAIQAAYERLKAKSGGVATADLDHAYQTLSNPQRRRIYDNARMDPRSLRALFNVEGRQEKVVWNIEGRRGEEPPPPPAPLDPWGLDGRHEEQPFDGDIELFDPLDEAADPEPAFSSTAAVPAVDDQEDEPEAPPGQETLPWDAPVQRPERSSFDDFALIAPVEVHPEPAPKAASESTTAARPAPRPKKKRARKSGARSSGSGKKAKQPAQAVETKAPTDKRRHARTAAAQLLAPTPADLEAVTLTSYNPADYAQEKPPSWWHPLNLLSLFSFLLFIAGGAAGAYYLWETSREEDEPVVAAESGLEESLVSPPIVESAVDPPQSVVDTARTYVEAFEGPLAERYEYLGLAALTLPDGSYFYAAVGRDRASLDGSRQRVFFFVDQGPLGADWPVDSRSLASVRALADGRIEVVYNAYAAGDEACCGTLQDVTVFFSYDQALVSSLAEPPPEIVAP